MISLKASRFLVECDDDYNHHIFVRSPHGYDEITNGDYDKDELINDLVYAVSELVKERDKKQYSILDKIRAEIEFEVDQRTNMLCAEDVFTILDKYKTESEDNNG